LRDIDHLLFMPNKLYKKCKVPSVILVSGITLLDVKFALGG